MTRINVDSMAFNDGRFSQLALLLGLADHDHARAKCEYLWHECTVRGEVALPRWLIERHLGESGPEALVQCELARWANGRGDSKTRRLYICGSRLRTSWLTNIREQSSKGGKSRARNAQRAAGKFVDATSNITEQSSKCAETAVPKSSVLTLALAPVLTRSRDKGVSTSRRKSTLTLSDSELETSNDVLSRLGTRNGVAYRKTATRMHQLIAARLREGHTALELRAVVAYVAEPTGLDWQDNPKMHKYLQPSTLFGPEKFQQYLDAAVSWARKHHPELFAVAEGT